MRYTLPITAIVLTLFTSCLKETINVAPTVEAGEAIITQLPKNTVLLNGAANDPDGSIVAVLWSQVSGPSNALLSAPTGLSTSAGELIVGEYTFKLTVTDDGGASVSDSVLVTVLDYELKTLSLQPANNPDEVHVFGSSKINQSGVASTELVGAAGTYFSDPVLIRAALKFDLTDVSSASDIVSAKLTLFSNPTPKNGNTGNANSGSDNSLLLQRINAPWVGEDVTWLDQPTSTADDQLIIPHSEEPFEDVQDLDVTVLVKKMVSMGNYGFLLRLQTEEAYNFRVFCSSKYADASKHPRLELVVRNSKVNGTL